jgi:AraC family transcriptional regulator, glycine betaine-responsive activator
MRTPVSDARPRDAAQAVELGRLARFAFLTLPNYSMIAFTSAVEVLRMANYIGRATYYSWSVVTQDGQPARASNGVEIMPTQRLDEHDPPDVLFVCGGTHIRSAADADTSALLQRMVDRGVMLGALCTGAYVLMRAGLLDGYHSAIHWEDMWALTREFPRVRLSEELFVVDRDRLSASGGTAPLDLMLHIVAARFGRARAAEISEQFILERIRGASDQQRIPVTARVGASRAEMLEVVRLMEANIEEPLSLAEIARLVHLSQRHVQRMFKLYLQTSPTHYYLRLRLKRARELLRQSNWSISRITSACGFQSACHFSKAYRAQFGYAPSAERRAPAAASAPDGMAHLGKFVSHAETLHE